MFGKGLDPYRAISYSGPIQSPGTREVVVSVADTAVEGYGRLRCFLGDGDNTVRSRGKAAGGVYRR